MRSGTKQRRGPSRALVESHTRPSAVFRPERNMPMTVLDKLCPGKNGKPCRWSVDIQNEPCLIPRAAPLCEICRANGDFNLKVLSRHLRNLYDLDPDIYKLALLEIPRYLWSIVLRSVMEFGHCRADATSFALAPCKINMLIKAADLATRDVNVLDLWRIRLAADTDAIISVGLAFSKRLPSADIRAHVADYVYATDLRELHRRLCYVKSHAYHVLSKQPFWHRVFDADTENDNTCHQMTRVYLNSIHGFHRPKLLHLRHTLKLHRRVSQRSFCHRRARWATKSIDICEASSHVTMSNDHPLSSMLQCLP